MKTKWIKLALPFILAILLVISVAGCSDAGASLNTAKEIYNQLEALSEEISEEEVTSTVSEPATTYPEDDAISTPTEEDSNSEDSEEELSEAGLYYSKEEVAKYIHAFGHLPDNFVTKNEARQKGWEGGSVEKYLPGCAIGGDKFGNYEGLLPKADGRTYTECDIDTLGESSRGAKRIVFSNDGLIYYTDDHYESFTLLYGEE